MKHLNVLVVEDESFQRNMMLRMLESLGITKTYYAADGEQGLTLLKQHPDIDILISDSPYVLKVA